MAQRDAGGVVTPVVIDQQARNVAGGNPDAGIVTGTGADWFGSLNPQRPSAPPEVVGRQLDYPTGYNLNILPRAYETVKFGDLRALADAYDVLRLVIETRKDQMARLEWAIKARKKAKGGKATEAVDPRTETIEAFFRYPDKVNAWDSWLRMLLEDMFVIDAPALYLRRTRGGDLYALEPIDGATIKRVIDNYGRTPVPPVPAYQQVLHGLPAVDYMTPNRDMFMAMMRQGAVGSQTINGVTRRFPAGELLYRPRNIRTNRVYGYSPVEQIILTVNTALRRQIFTLQYFTEGNIPEAFIGVPDTWTPDQISAFQQWWDSVLEGNTAARRHAKFVPGGMDIKTTKEPELKGVFDEWLARVVCFAFSISPQPFVSSMNRATAQTAKEAATEEGLAPTMHWVKQMMDFIIATEFKAPDLEFEWAEEDETNPVDQETILSGYTKSGIMSVDEARDKMGLEAAPNGAGADLRVFTPTGYVPIDAYADQVAAQQAATEATAAAAKARAEQPALPAPGTENVAPAKGDGEVQPNAKEVGKAAGAPFVKAKPGPVPYPRKSTRTAVINMASVWAKVLGRQAIAISAATRGTLFKAAPMDEGRHTVDDFVQNLDLGLTSGEVDDLFKEYAQVASDSGDIAFAQIGSDGDMFEQINAAAEAWARDHAATLVSQVGDTTRDLVRAAIADGTANGLSTDEIAANIEELGAFSPERSALIANTEIAAANSHGALEGYRAAVDDGVAVKKAWLLGADPCDICLDNADAGAIDLDEDFPSGDDAPPGHPRCLPGDGLVLAEGITGATKRWYDGDLVVIDTAGGKQLRLTPNHPVLTPGGWVAAGLINEGSDVISSDRGEWGALHLDLDDNDMPARIEDVAEAFGRSGQVFATPVPTAPEDFHGDGIGSKVAIVWTDSVLRHGADTALAEHGGQPQLRAVDVIAANHVGAGAHDLLIEGIGPSSCGDMGGSSLKPPLFGSETGSPQQSRIGYGAPDDAGSGEPATDCLSVNAIPGSNGLLGVAGSVGRGDLGNWQGFLPTTGLDAGSSERSENNRFGNAGLPSDLGDAFTGNVFPDAIVSVRRIRFAGHVYNLQTDRGYYLASGIVVHNCECALTPVVGDDES